MSETCENCRYFVPDSEQAKRYFITDRHCRRMPQKLHKDPEDWCGEWAPSRKLASSSVLEEIQRTMAMEAKLDAMVTLPGEHGPTHACPICDKIRGGPPA